MEDKNSIKSVKKFFDNDKIRNFIIIAGIVGIALIFLSSYIDFGSLSGKKEEEEFSVTTYSTKIETISSL